MINAFTIPTLFCLLIGLLQRNRKSYISSIQIIFCVSSLALIAKSSRHYSVLIPFALIFIAETVRCGKCLKKIYSLLVLISIVYNIQYDLHKNTREIFFTNYLKTINQKRNLVVVCDKDEKRFSRLLSGTEVVSYSEIDVSHPRIYAFLNRFRYNRANVYIVTKKLPFNINKNYKKLFCSPEKEIYKQKKYTDTVDYNDFSITVNYNPNVEYEMYEDAYRETIKLLKSRGFTFFMEKAPQLPRGYEIFIPTETRLDSSPEVEMVSDCNAEKYLRLRIKKDYLYVLIKKSIDQENDYLLCFDIKAVEGTRYQIVIFHNQIKEVLADNTLTENCSQKEKICISKECLVGKDNYLSFAILKGEMLLNHIYLRKKQ